jgi:hypothetical protein
VLFDISKTDTKRIYRSNTADRFTIRQLASTKDDKYYFEWSLIDEANLVCVTQVADSFFEDQWKRYRQTTFVLAKEECKEDIVQYKVDEAGVVDTEDKHVFQVVVWPTRQPEEKGTLIALDGYDLATTIEMKALEEITVRVTEKAEGDKLEGFTWESPKQEFKCIELLNNNLGDFVTGWEQWHFKAFDRDEDCEEDVILKKADGSGEDTVKVKVLKGHCKVIDCPEGEIQDMKLDACTCNPLAAAVGTLIDTSKDDNRVLWLKKDD